MSKKYKHIILPRELIGSEKQYVVNHNGRNIQHLPGFSNLAEHKKILANEFSYLAKVSNQVKSARKIEADKNFTDVKIKFQGTANKELLDRYRISVYSKYDDRPAEQEYANDVVLGRVSTTKLPRQKYSAFERMELEFKKYLESNRLVSVFGVVENFSPLELKEIVSDELKSELDKAGDSRILMDIILGDNQEISQLKLNKIKQDLGDNFVTGVNTQNAHYCRVVASSSELNKIISSYAGIIGVEEPPLVVFSSGVKSQLNNYSVVNHASSDMSVMVLDHPVCINHPLLSQLSENQIGDGFSTNSDAHGTQVASLVIYGTKISSGGNLDAKNRVLPVNIFPIIKGQSQFDESAIIEALKKNYSLDKPLIANFSVNDYRMYSRKKVHRLTKLFDDLAVDFNCLFIISAGNLFKQWPPALQQYIAGLGYPNYFNETVTTILPPADSINNLTIGSVTYQASPNSLAPVKEPSPITRRGFTETKGFCYVKPDLVNFDSNFDLNFNSEDNGPFMACPTSSLVREAGTSFATPLAAHELGILAQAYPKYKVNTLKALLIHFATPINSALQVNTDIAKSLVGHGIPDIDRTLYSLNTSSTLVIEDSISVGTSKRIKFPIPACIAGSNKNRLLVRKTLVYNPKVNGIDVNSYNPILIAAKIIREDGKEQDNATSRSFLDGAHKKSNVKVYNPIERSTIKHTGQFWEIEVTAESVNDLIPNGTEQSYSIIISIEDINKDESVDLHANIQQMIEVIVGSSINIQV